MLHIPTGMRPLFASTTASRPWHISSGRIAHLRFKRLAPPTAASRLSRRSSSVAGGKTVPVPRTRAQRRGKTTKAQRHSAAEPQPRSSRWSSLRPTASRPDVTVISSGSLKREGRKGRKVREEGNGLLGPEGQAEESAGVQVQIVQPQTVVEDSA